MKMLTSNAKTTCLFLIGLSTIILEFLDSINKTTLSLHAEFTKIAKNILAHLKINNVFY